MSSIEKRTRDGQTTWLARWRDPGGRQHKRSFPKKSDAQRFVTTLGADQLRGQYIDPTDRTTFRAYAEAWRAAQAHRPTTQAHVETHLRRHAYPVFGARRLATILPSEVQAWTAGLTAAGLAPSTVQVIHGIVASVFKAAVRDRKLASSPCETTRLPRKVKTRIVPLGTSVVTALVDAMPERLAALVILAAGTGLRQGEAFGLTVDRIDFLRRTLTVDRQLVLLPRQAPYLAPVKTEASNRTVPLPRVVVDALADHLRRYPAGPNGWVFTDDTGAPLRRTAFSREVWRPAVTAAGAPAGTGFHDLRHYYASLLIAHGESIKVVQARLGHATAAETLDTYAHLWPDSEDQTRAAIDSVLGASRAPSVPRKAVTRP